MSHRYVKEKLLGKGRAGEVYKAIDSVLGRPVALRRFSNHTLSADNISEEWKAEFMNIVAGLSRVSHSNILRVIDGGIDDEGPFLVTTYTKGKTPSELTYGEGGFDIVDAHEMITQILDALLVAQDEDFFHLAMSPTSIIAQPRHTSGYNYFLVDLGHSKLLPLIHGSEKAATMTQLPALIAPEVYEGRAAGVQSCQYILGHLVYWMLAGGHPFGNLSAAEAYKKHKAGDIAPLQTYRREVSGGFVNWLGIMMDPDPSKRFSSLVEALTSLPKPPARLYAKKITLPPKPISEKDL